MVAYVPTLAVSVIYCIWYHYRLACWQRERVLRQRVANMLWAMAMQMD